MTNNNYINLNEYKASKNHRKTLKQEIHVAVKPYAEADKDKIQTLRFICPACLMYEDEECDIRGSK